MSERTFRFLTMVGLVASAAVAGGEEAQTTRDAVREAALRGNVVAIRQLVAQGADPNDGCPIVAAIKKDDIDTVSALLALGAKADCKGSPDAFADHTPLNMALIFPRVRTARILVAHGADVNAIPGPLERHDTSPLLSAVWNYQLVQPPERKEWVVLLEEMITHGANIHSRDKSGRTALGTALLACRSTDTEPVVSLLLKHKVDPNEPTGSAYDDPQLPLESAIVGKCSDATVHALLKAGANPVIRGDATRLTELAHGRNDPALLALLVQYGAVDAEKNKNP